MNKQNKHFKEFDKCEGLMCGKCGLDFDDCECNLKEINEIAKSNNLPSRDFWVSVNTSYEVRKEDYLPALIKGLSIARNKLNREIATLKKANLKQ